MNQTHISPRPESLHNNHAPSPTLERSGASQENQEVSQIKPPSAMSLFVSEVLPHLSRAKGFVLADGPASLPPEITTFLSKPENSALAIGILADYGIPQGLTRAQQHALSVAVLPHLSEGTPAHCVTLMRIADHAVRTRDYDLYQVLGNAALGMSLPPEIIFGLAQSFSCLSTHNVANEPFLKPWLDLFEKRADGATYALLVDKLFSRLHEGHLSSYDHIVTALCRSPRADARLLLETSIFPLALIPQDATIRPSLRFLVQAVARNTSLAIPVSTAFAVVLHGFTPSALMTAGLGIVFSVAMLTSREFQAAKTTVTSHLQRGVEFLDGKAFMYYAERVYQKLLKFSSADCRNEKLINKIECSPRYAEHISSWKQALSV